MPVAKNMTERSEQIFRWLCNKYPTPYKCELKWVKHLIDLSATDDANRFYYADTMLHNRKLTIRLAKRKIHEYGMMIDCVLHEYAHAMDWRHARIEDKGRRIHGPEWALHYGTLYEDYHDLDGWKKSREF